MLVGKKKKRIGIVGGGPSALFAFKRLIESGSTDFEIIIFEKNKRLGAGMPYSADGANKEHITNVSDHEVPDIVTPIKKWVKKAPAKLLKQFHIDRKKFNTHHVLPRLLFGHYLSDQFDLLLNKAKKRGIKTSVFFQSRVNDISYNKKKEQATIYIEGKKPKQVDFAIICTGHHWRITHEGKVPGYFDSPYPPSKLAIKFNHPVALKGSSLTAIDAIRTLARQCGTFGRDKRGDLIYRADEDCPQFKLILHSRNGLLPSVRFYTEDPQQSNTDLLTRKEIANHISKNNGFLSLDFIFKKDFKELLKKKSPQFYTRIKKLRMEEFVDAMMEFREKMEPFQLLEKEYEEAKESKRRKESIHWKELLSILSFAMNYPAKYFSAEDMQRLKEKLMPLISIIIAFVPQSSCEELLALHRVGRLELIPVGEESVVSISKKKEILYRYYLEGKQEEIVYKTFIDCTGQPHLAYEDFTFKSLLKNKNISPAYLQFRNPKNGKKAFNKKNKELKKEANEYYLKVPGIAINDAFQIIDKKDIPNKRIYMMAVPYMGGYNPDYSGLDFCYKASDHVVSSILNELI
ncbi:MAG TPA: FAD/NAD(P)-binding protein [Bacteroidia bacterium]|jgi:uncharacterized NAD(P)/FAD-binding protein YdhS|nr:FAD/NAD(P)-binding protein [Bacteroidia bacterium]